MFSVFRCVLPPGSNVYFVNTDPAVIIDTGHPVSAEQTIDILKRTIPLDNVGYILCTHAHGDHIGNASVLQNACHAKTMIFKPETNSKLTDSHKREIGLLYNIPEIDTYLEPDMEIVLRNDTIRVLHTPGHADEHCCFYFTKRKFLFTGDLLAHEDIGFLNLNKHYTKALDETKLSVERCAALETTRVFTGHGDPYRSAPWHKIIRKLSLFERNPMLLVPHVLISPFLFHLWAAEKPVPVAAAEAYITNHAYLFDGFLENCTPELILQEFMKIAALLTIRGVVKRTDNCYTHTMGNQLTWHWYKGMMNV
jgi:glyoxylase-like metal-dependent hydrolase (beta-lactamase superfamily II)